MKHFIIFFLVTILLISCSSSSDIKNNIETNSTKDTIEQYGYIEGYTQGSTFHIKYKMNGDSIPFSEIETILTGIDNSLSIYIDNSIISRINNNDPNVTTDKYFEDVFEMADSVYRISKGMFDMTVGPLVKAWGFTPGGEHNALNIDQITKLKTIVGFDKVKLTDHKLIKSNPKILIDPNAIAQGYTVEAISDYFKTKGITDYMIEIGGEVKAVGVNDKGEFWKIGIDKPIPDDLNLDHELQSIVKVSNKSVCTSGSYRKFIEENGVKYSHEINPKTGLASHHNLLSVTVITENCTYADALATAIMVMGLDEGKKFAEQHKEIEVYLIYSDDKGEFKTWNTPGFEEMTVPMN